MSSLCKCGTVRDKKFAGPTAKFPNRAFYTCSSCGKFDWANQAGHVAAAAWLRVKGPVG